MKRTAISLLLALALVLCAVLVTAPQAQAVTQPCTGTHTEALPTTGGELAAGTYYVAADATLAATITIPADAEVTICLNGKTLTAPENERAFLMDKAGATLKICDCSGTNAGTIKGNGVWNDHGGVIYVSAASTLELYSGTITGGSIKNDASNKVGGNIALNNADALFNMYGGKITNGYGDEEKCRGGNVGIQSGAMVMHDGTISGGKAQRGGNIIGVNGTITIKAGVITGGETIGDAKNVRGGNINIDKANLVIESGTITGATGVAGNNIQFNDNGKLNGTKLLDALDAAVANGKVTIDGIVHMGKWNNQGSAARAEQWKLYSDIPSTYSVAFGNQDRYIDLNGHSFAGTLDVTSTTTAAKTLYVIDTSTDDFTTVSTGVYSGQVINDTNNYITKAASGVAMANKGYERYLEINGTYQRFSLGIDAVSLELDANGNVGLGYSALIKGNSAVQGALSSFGIHVGKADSYDNTNTDPLVHKAKAKADFVPGAAGNKVTLRVNKVMTCNNGVYDNTNAAEKVKVQAFITVGETTIWGNDAVSVSVQDVVDAAAEQLTKKPAEAATYPEFYALIEEIKTKYSITAA